MKTRKRVLRLLPQIRQSCPYLFTYSDMQGLSSVVTKKQHYNGYNFSKLRRANLDCDIGGGSP